VAEVAWHGCLLDQPGWNDPECRVLSFTLGGLHDEEDLHVILNMTDQGADFELPDVAGQRWTLAVDTARPSPHDVLDPGAETPVEGGAYHTSGRSTVVLVSQARGDVDKP
jgi:glycogen operon protein